MEQKQNTNHAEDEVTYNILLQRHINDDRLMGERSTAFLAGSSILFLGFATLLHIMKTDSWLCILIPILGFSLSVLSILSNRRTSKGLEFWEKNEKEIEQKGDSFDYMRQRAMEPYHVYDQQKKLTGLRNRWIYTYAFPGVFIILWFSLLIWVKF